MTGKFGWRAEEKEVERCRLSPVSDAQIEQYKGGELSENLII